VKRALAAAFSALVAISTVSSAAGAAEATTRTGIFTPARIAAGLQSRAVCAPVTPNLARCMSLVLVRRDGSVFASGSPAGYGPADFQSAYRLPSATHGAGETVAVVDAYDDPQAELDLSVYRHTFGLPPCTTSNGCFRKTDVNGGDNYPTPNSNWALEISLDIDVVSAICPNCHILLVEAKSERETALLKGDVEAAHLGANAISDSWGWYERRKDELHQDEHFLNFPGIAMTASTGDSGYGPEYPATSKYVTAVGGTHLVPAGNKRGWSETAWIFGGSGCSKFEPKQSWQTDVGCKHRTEADVSAAGDPLHSGASVYDTYGYKGWVVVGGTSESSPLIASVYALAGDSVMYESRVYENPEKLFDITSGSNGTCHKRPYLCNAGPGYDGPTGLGTPNGIGDF